MKLFVSLVILGLTFLEAKGSPYRYYSSSGDVDTWVRSGDAGRGGMVLSRSYDPYYNRRTVRGSPSTYSLRQPQTVLRQQASHAAARRQALLEVNDIPPQQNEVYFPQAAEQQENFPIVSNEPTELLAPVENTELTPTPIVVDIPDLPEPEIKVVPEAPVEKPIKDVNKKKEPKTPIDDEEDDEDDSYPKLPNGAYFPIFLGYGGKSGGEGLIAIANSFSTGRGGVATSDATAYGTPKFERKV